MQNFQPFRCVVMGKESLLIQCVDILRQRGHVVQAIITNEESIRQWAAEQAIPVLDDDKSLTDELHAFEFDYFFSITNLSIIPAEVLQQAGTMAINFHDGPLPKYAGLYATSWALMHEEQQHGVTWHTMEVEVDKGDILKQVLFDVTEGETAFTLNVKCYENAITSFAELVDELGQGTVQHQAQNLAEQTYFGKYDRPVAAGTIDWNQTARKIDALVRALDFGSYENPLGRPKLLVGKQVYIVPSVKATADFTNERPGTILNVAGPALTIATGGGTIILDKIISSNGSEHAASIILDQHGLQKGDQLPLLDTDTIDRLNRLNSGVSRHEEKWVTGLSQLNSIELPYATRGQAVESVQYDSMPLNLPTAVATLIAEKEKPGDYLTAAFASFLSRLSGDEHFQLSYTDQHLRAELSGFEGIFATRVPLQCVIASKKSAQNSIDEMLSSLSNVRKHKSFSLDTILRYPQLDSLKDNGAHLPLSIGVEQVDHINGSLLKPQGLELAFVVTKNADQIVWVHDSSVYTSAAVKQLQTQFITFLENILRDSSGPLANISVLTGSERQKLLVDWNSNTKQFDRSATIHSLFSAQAVRTPDATAIAFENESMSYGELDKRTNQLAHHLQELGIGPESRVGIFMDRGLDMIVGLLGILKAGGAYLPLDPTYPSDRIAFMVEDAATPVLLTQERRAGDLPAHNAKVLRIDSDWEKIAQQSAAPVSATSDADNLSYVIYTSGSTGKPKGVMIRHRNAVNFFQGMDDDIPYSEGDTWLTVTSLSFDISVLEIFWSLTRGLKLVIYADDDRKAATGIHSHKAVDFSLFYFSSDESEEGVPNKYHLLLEGAKYGDKHGFSAVWTPERHFHAFGGLYPNPAVTGAAIAAVTEHVQIRSGSCVLPLHSPIRVAEDWSVVDNMSNGRVGLSIASGWQPNDFVLRPGNYAQRKEIMFRDIEVVKELWRGGSVTMTNDLGKEVEVKTLPHPVQHELPIWITAAGNPETFRMAGERGYNILTHLLGQSVEELAEKIVVYRNAWQDAGHEGQGTVSLMLHTFISDDHDKVREIVREPMKGYLSSAMNLVRQAAWHFPTFKEKAEATGKSPFEIFDEEELSDVEIDALLNFAFERYYVTSGLFGTPESALAMVDQIKGIDVDDIACLIDFGIKSSIVLENLPFLNQLRELATPAAEEEDFSIPALIEKHDVTHFQCTPSMGSMLVVDERFQQAAANLKVCMMGGEAFPQSLARDISGIVNGKVLNMYGPTETTIWSSTFAVTHGDAPVSIGRPIANQQMYVVDRNLQPVPVGVPGELLIGGDGVVRGYLNRPELTNERFIPDHFRPDQAGAMLYRTGDLVRYRDDGNIDFLGRIDFQVKIRGYRIELGEIEALLNEHVAVREAVVTAREDAPGDKRLVAYIIPQAGQQVDSNELRDHLQQNLPEFMVPAHYVTLDRFPLTPNKKTDRKALPAPDQVKLKAKAVYIAPENASEQKIVTIWQELLGVEQVGVNDNFFDLGGHSLLAVQLHRMVKEAVQAELSITDIFRFPTIRSLTQYLGNQEAEAEAAKQKVSDRAAARREAMANRRNRRRR